MSSIQDFYHPICPKCKSSNIIGVEYCLTPEDYDGISESQCQDCGYREGRWTGMELPPDYIEPRYGKGGKPVFYKKSIDN